MTKSEIVLDASFGETRVSATVDAIGASLLSARVGEIEIVQPPARDGSQRFDLYVGSSLFPWCNRTKNGTWLDPKGQIQHLPINEPKQNNALHGFVAQREFALVSQDPAKVSLEIAIGPEPGYAFQLGLRVSYVLEPNGIRCEYLVHNFGRTKAPFSLAAHPYLKLGDLDTGDLLLRSGAEKVYEQDKQQIPVGLKGTANTKFDFRAGARVRDLSLDDYFVDLPLAGDGKRHTQLIGPDSLVDVWQDADFKHLVIFNTSKFESNTGPIHAIAIEPSTSAVNALNSDEDLIWLESERGWSASWGVRLLGKSAESAALQS